MGEQRVQEGAEHAPLWGPSVEDQRSGGVVSYIPHLGAACQEVKDPIAQGRVQTQGLELNLSGIVWDASVPPRQQPVKLQGAKFKTAEIS